ncbi:DUF421 domain-containing protein [Paenibacillus sanguinis]|uniref:DUF421 domain-containing protein n=1 Tax=Paenibacillus sanguinis TaxID=225906 RepID=UPI000370DA4F|nr:DUF421 domain-containing protein [Paenibacillus sanguinis]
MPIWVEIILRTLLAAVVLFIITRLLGKRQISQLSFFEYTTGITIGSLAAYISLDVDVEWYIGLVAVGVWFLISISVEYVQLKSKRFRSWIDSSSTVLIQDGKILEGNLKKERLTNEELLEQLRKKSIFKTAEVEFAVMEPDGQINALLKTEHQPLTPAQLGLKVPPEPEPQTIILSGNIMNEPMAALGLSHRWLNNELKKLGVSLEQVNLGQVDAYGQFYVDLYDDRINIPQPQEQASVLLAQLKKCEEVLQSLARSATDDRTKQLYGNCSSTLEQVIDQMKGLSKQMPQH